MTIFFYSSGSILFKINEMRVDGIINYSLLNVLSTECR